MVLHPKPSRAERIQSQGKHTYGNVEKLQKLKPFGPAKLLVIPAERSVEPSQQLGQLRDRNESAAQSEHRKD